MPATAMLNESRLQRVLGGGQIGIVVVWAGFIAGVWAGAWRLGAQPGAGRADAEHRVKA